MHQQLSFIIVLLQHLNLLYNGVFLHHLLCLNNKRWLELYYFFQQHEINYFLSFLFWFPESEQTEQDLAREVQRADVVCLVYVFHHHTYYSKGTTTNAVC